MNTILLLLSVLVANSAWAISPPPTAKMNKLLGESGLSLPPANTSNPLSVKVDYSN